MVRNFDGSDGGRSSFFIKNINTRCPCTKTIKVLLVFEGFGLLFFPSTSGDSTQWFVTVTSWFPEIFGVSFYFIFHLFSILFDLDAGGFRFHEIHLSNDQNRPWSWNRWNSIDFLAQIWLFSAKIQWNPVVNDVFWSAKGCLRDMWPFPIFSKMFHDEFYERNTKENAWFDHSEKPAQNSVNTGRTNFK